MSFRNSNQNNNSMQSSNYQDSNSLEFLQNNIQQNNQSQVDNFNNENQNENVYENEANNEDDNYYNEYYNEEADNNNENIYNENEDYYENEENKRISRNDKLYLIFINNSVYIPEKNKYFLSQQNLYKIIKKIVLPFDINKIDLIFKRISPKSLQINFDQFQQFLILLCEKENPFQFKRNKKEAMNTFLSLLFAKFQIVINYGVNNDKNETSKYFYNSINKLFNYKPNDSQLYILEQINSSLMEIYEKYFNDGTKNEIYSQENILRYIIEFSRDFEIIPFYLSETQMSTYYFLSNEKENPNQKLDFTFEHFKMFFIRISIYIYEKFFKTNNDKTSEVGKLLLFLERLEFSKGMKNFSRKLSRPNAKQLSLIPNKNVYKELNEVCNIEIDVNNNDDNENMQNNMLIKNNLSAFETTFSYFCSHGNKFNNLMNLSSYIKFLKHCKIYKEVFENQRKKFNQISNEMIKKELSYNKGFSNQRFYNQNNNYKTNEQKKYIKTITKIVNSSNNNSLIGESDVNIIFSYLTGPRNYNFNEYYQKMLDKNSGCSTAIWTNEEKQFNTKAINNKNTNEEEKSHKILRMDFKTFLLSLKFIARKIYSNLYIDQALDNLLKNRIIPNLIYKDNNIINVNKNFYYFDNLEKVYEYLKDEEFTFCINKLKQVMNMYFKIYFDTKTIVFNQFFNFYTDFSIFPDIINLSQIKTLFAFLSQKTKLEENKNLNSINEISKEQYINSNLFALSFAIVSKIYNLNETNDFILNIVGLIEKMNKSEGVKKCILKIGRTYTKSNDFVSFLESMKNKYPNELSFSNIENNIYPIKDNKNLPVLNDIFDDE